MNPYLNQYQNTQVNTSSPGQILIMLFDGAIRFVCQAQDAMAAGATKVKAEKISKAIAIISELANTLDHDIGGEIAEKLDALYNYMIRELIHANLQGSRQSLDVVGNLLAELKETWVQAIALHHNKTDAVAGPGDQLGEKGAVYKPLQASL
jgi:flagellar protein FliS